MDLRCQYASTHCPNTRSLKISGELHRFCLFHRRSANAAQRRWKQKKLAEATGMTTGSTSTATTTSSSSSDEDATAKKRRRPRCETAAATTLKQEQAPAAKRPRPSRQSRLSREIAAPRHYQSTQRPVATHEPSQWFTPMLPAATGVDELPPLFATDDMGLLSTLLDETITTTYDAFPSLAWDTTEAPVSMPADCWWADVSRHRESGVIV